jgi:hypothetical protein
VGSYSVELMVNVGELEKMNREYLVSGGMFDGVFGEVKSFGETIKQTYEKNKEFSFNGLIDKVKSQTFDIKNVTKSSEDVFSSLSKKFNEFNTPKKEISKLSDTELARYINLLFICIPNVTQNPSEKLLQLLILVIHSLTFEFVEENSRILENLIFDLHRKKLGDGSQSLMKYRIPHIQKSAYEVLEPIVIKLWNHNFTGTQQLNFRRIQIRLQK